MGIVAAMNLLCRSRGFREALKAAIPAAAGDLDLHLTMTFGVAEGFERLP